VPHGRAEFDPNLLQDAADFLVMEGGLLRNTTRLVLMRDYSPANSFKAPRTSGLRRRANNGAIVLAKHV